MLASREPSEVVLAADAGNAGVRRARLLIEIQNREASEVFLQAREPGMGDERERLGSASREQPLAQCALARGRPWEDRSDRGARAHPLAVGGGRAWEDRSDPRRTQRGIEMLAAQRQSRRQRWATLHRRSPRMVIPLLVPRCATDCRTWTRSAAAANVRCIPTPHRNCRNLSNPRGTGTGHPVSSPHRYCRNEQPG